MTNSAGALRCSRAEGGSAVFRSISSWKGLGWPLQSPSPPACPHQEGSAPRSGFQASRNQWGECRRPRPFRFPSCLLPLPQQIRFGGQTGRQCLFLSVLERLTISLPHYARQNSPAALCLCIQPTFTEGLLCARHPSKCWEPSSKPDRHRISSQGVCSRD